MITTLEELSLNAWPALQTVLYDGWIVRFADGYTKRANSINPIYVSNQDVDAKIRFCESLYQQRNLPIVFKMTASVHPVDLDQELATKGYQINSPTSVQTIDLNAVDWQVPSAAERQYELSDTWLESFCNMSAVPDTHRMTLQKILTSIIPKCCFVSMKVNERNVACGLGVLQSGYIGLFDIVTDPGFRKRGYGYQVVNSILDWGKQNGAQTGYLQVMLDNIPALRLYSKIGFEEQYQYWYRVKP